MKIKGEDYYRWLAYERAAESVGSLGRPVSEVEDITKLPHVGGTTAEVIRELAENRTPQILADLLAEIPPGLVEMTRLPGMGPRTAGDRKSTRLNSSHANISYAVFCLKKQKNLIPTSTCNEKKKQVRS